MLSLWKRKRQPLTLTRIEATPPDDNARRNKQKYLKASADCIAAFAAIAKASHMSEAALFEDMVAERLELLARQGVNLSITNE
jgi:hypothetical protein